MDTNTEAAPDAGATNTAVNTATPSGKGAALAGMKVLSAADILAMPDVVHEWVGVPEWGGKVLVKSLSGTERDSFEASLMVKRGKERELSTRNIRAKLCQLTIVDPDSENQLRPVFTEEQIDALGRKSAAALSRVYDAASRLSGLSEADVEELRGNSGAAPSAASSSK